jgi:hypothetical protein
MKFSTVYTNPKKFTTERVDTSDINFTIVEPASPVQVALGYRMDSGGFAFINWGDGHIDHLTTDGITHQVLHDYSSAGTYQFRLCGTLDLFKYWQCSCSEMNIDITQFNNTPNIEFIAVGGYPRTLTGSINGLHYLKEFWTGYPIIPGIGITGNINNCPLIEVWELQGDGGTNNPCSLVTGKFENLRHLREWCCVSNVDGDITGLPLEFFSWSSLDPAKFITGDISTMINLWTYYGEPGSELVTGNTALLVNLEIFQPKLGVTKPANLLHMPKLCKFEAPWLLNRAEVNEYVANFWANRNVVRTHYTNLTLHRPIGEEYRRIKIDSFNTPPPNGQGLIDAANLSVFISPTPPATGDAWLLQLNTEFVNQSNWYQLSYWDLVCDANWSTDWVLHRLISNGTTGNIIKANLWTPLFWTAGQKYRVTITCTVNSGGIYGPYDNSTPTIPGWIIASGTYTYDYIPVNDQIKIESSLFNGSIDAISITETV